MRGREAPGRVVHPGPAPRFLPNPMTVPIGRPIGFDPAGEPHGAVAAHRAPAAILIQVRVAHHIVVEVAQGRGAGQTPVALETVAIEIVLSAADRTSRNRANRYCRSAPYRLRARENWHFRRRPRRRLPTPRWWLHCCAGRRRCDSDLPVDGECQRRCVHFKDLPGVHAPHAQVERALRHLKLRDTDRSDPESRRWCSTRSGRRRCLPETPRGHRDRSTAGRRGSADDCAPRRPTRPRQPASSSPRPGYGLRCATRSGGSA